MIKKTTETIKKRPNDLPHILWQLGEKYLKKSQYLSIKPQPQFQEIHGIQPRPQPWKMKKKQVKTSMDKFEQV